MSSVVYWEYRRHTATVVVIVRDFLFPGQQNLTTAIKITML